MNFRGRGQSHLSPDISGFLRSHITMERAVAGQTTHLQDGRWNIECGRSKLEIPVPEISMFSQNALFSSNKGSTLKYRPLVLVITVFFVAMPLTLPLLISKSTFSYHYKEKVYN